MEHNLDSSHTIVVKSEARHYLRARRAPAYSSASPSETQALMALLELSALKTAASTAALLLIAQPGSKPLKISDLIAHPEAITLIAHVMNPWMKNRNGRAKTKPHHVTGRETLREWTWMKIRGLRRPRVIRMTESGAVERALRMCMQKNVADITLLNRGGVEMMMTKLRIGLSEERAISDIGTTTEHIPTTVIKMEPPNLTAATVRGCRTLTSAIMMTADQKVPISGLEMRVDPTVLISAHEMMTGLKVDIHAIVTVIPTESLHVQVATKIKMTVMSSGNRMDSA